MFYTLVLIYVIQLTEKKLCSQFENKNKTKSLEFHIFPYKMEKAKPPKFACHYLCFQSFYLPSPPKSENIPCSNHQEKSRSLIIPGGAC